MFVRVTAFNGSVARGFHGWHNECEITFFL